MKKLTSWIVLSVIAIFDVASGHGTDLNGGISNITDPSELIGMVQFNGGILQFGAPLNVTNAMSFNVVSNIIDTQANDSIVSGWITGPGGLTKMGSGTLTLASAANTFSGLSNINQGTVNVANSSALGTGDVAFNGGNLQFGAPLTLGNNLILNAPTTAFDTPSTNFTLSGTISGSGGLTKVDNGSLTLSGSNTYSGGTNLNSGILNIANAAGLGTGPLAFNGGVLQFGAPVTLANSMTLNASDNSFDTQAFNAGVSGVIGGTGGLIKSGNGTLALSGANTYQGETILLAGILNVVNPSALSAGQVWFYGGALQFGAPVTLANALSFNAANNMIDTQGFNSTLSGAISGPGGFTKIGSGVLALTGANSFSGLSNINEGTVVVTNSASLGTSKVAFSGGNLQFGAPMTLTNNLILNSPIGIPTNYIGTQNYNATLSGGISGIGGLEKKGDGTLELSGANTYTGGTMVTAGTLLLAANGSLPSAGALIVNTGATVDMQGTKQTVASFASYYGVGTGVRTLKLAIPASGGPNLNITGNADFAGAVLNPSFQGQIISDKERFRVLTYGNLIHGFDAVLSPALIHLTPKYDDPLDPHTLYLTATLIPLRQIAKTPNQSSVGDALAGPVSAGLYSSNLSVPQAQAALDQIGPISLASMSGVSMASSMVQATAVGQRLISLADGSDHGSFSAYAANTHSTLSDNLLASAGTDDTTMFDFRENKRSGSSSSPWGFFASAAGTAGSLNGLDSGSGYQPGYAFNSGGITGGADYRVKENIVAGASLGYLRGHASIYSPGSGTVDSDSARYGIYATTFEEKWRANLYVGGASDFFTTNRGIPYVSQTAAASPTGTEFNAQGSASYDFPVGDWGLLSPFAGLNYDRLMVHSFSESGAGAWDLSVNPQTAESLRSSLGLRVSKKFQWDSHVWTPYASFGWHHEFDSQERAIDAQLASGVGSAFSVKTANTARNGAIVGAGTSVAMTDSTSIRFNYNGDYRSDFRNNSLDASVRYRF